MSPGRRVRPTAEIVRDAWLAALGDQVVGARVLDLFAGSGALGLEALSRGARSVDFVENGSASLHALKANVAALPVRDRTRIFRRDAIPFVESLEAGSYDLAFADPPYGSRKLDRVVGHWLQVPFARILSVEHGREHALPGKGLTLDFGETRVTIFGMVRSASPGAGRPPSSGPAGSPGKGARRGRGAGSEARGEGPDADRGSAPPARRRRRRR